MNSIKYPSRAIITVGKPDGHRQIHIGHLSGGLINADIFARFLRNRIGHENVLFVTATECYGTAVYDEYLKSKEENESVEDYIYSNHLKQKEILRKFQISLNHFCCDVSDDELHTIHSKLCQKFIDSLVKNNNVVSKREKILVDPETSTFLNYRQVQSNGKSNMKSKKYDVEDINGLISIMSSKKPIIKEVDNYFFVLSERKDFITELHRKRYAKMEKYLKGIYPLSNSNDDENNVDTVRLTCNSNLGINIEIDNKSKKLWNWIESLIAPISYTMYHEFQQSRELSGWRKWWSEEQSEVYHFMAQDNVFFYMVVEPYLIKSWNDINKENIKFPNYVLMPMRTIFNGKYEGPFPTGEILLNKYDVEALRYSIASMGNKISSFNPEKLIDGSLKKDNIDFKYNAIIRKINRLQFMAEKQMKDIPQNIFVSQECIEKGKSIFNKYEAIMMSQEFGKAIDLIEENFKDFLNDKDNILYNTKLAYVMLFSFIPETIKEKYISIYDDKDLFENYNPENQKIDIKKSNKELENSR